MPIEQTPMPGELEGESQVEEDIKEQGEDREKEKSRELEPDEKYFLRVLLAKTRAREKFEAMLDKGIEDETAYRISFTGFDEMREFLGLDKKKDFTSKDRLAFLKKKLETENGLSEEGRKCLEIEIEMLSAEEAYEQTRKIMGEERIQRINEALL